MIDFKKLHGDLLLHQALLTAALAANNSIQQVSPTSSLSPTEANNQRKEQIENSSFNDISYDCLSSMSSLCSNSPNDLSPSSVPIEDKICKNRESSCNNESYQVLSKKLKTEHHDENFSHQAIEINTNQTSEKKIEENIFKIDQHPVDDCAASPLSITVNSTSPLGNSNQFNSNKRKLSDYETSILPESLNDAKFQEQKAERILNCRSESNKSLKSNLFNKQKCDDSSSVFSLSSSLHLSNESSLFYNNAQNISDFKSNNINNTKSSFMISDILGLENNNSSTFSPTQFDPKTQISNEQLFQQCQVQLQRAFPYLTNLTNNQSNLFRLIANTLAIEQQTKYLNSNSASDNANTNFFKNIAASSTPILTSPKTNTSKYYNIVNSSSSPISYQNKSSPDPANVQSPKQTNISHIEKKIPTASTANLILSSLEQLTYNQFKDYSSSSRKNGNDTDSNLSLSKKLSSCTSNSSTSQLSPLSSLSSLSTSSSSSLSSSLLASKNSNRAIGNRSSSSEQINRKSITKNEILDTSSSVNINKSASEQNGNLWPAWVYCTRYSDRPSAGPRHRKKNKKVPYSLNTSSSSNSTKGNIETISSVTNENSRQFTNEQSALTRTFKHDDGNFGGKKNSDMVYLSNFNNSNNQGSISSSNIEKNATILNKMSAYNNNYLSFSKYSNNNDAEIKADDESSSSIYLSNENENIEEDSRPPSEENNYYDKSVIKSGLNNRDDNSNNNRNLEDDDEYFSDNDSDNSHSKRPRTAFTGSQLNRLKHEFEKCKYLTGEKRQFLANELKLNESQIKIWFQNKRAKIKKSSGVKNTLALQLMAQGLYNHGSNKNDEDNYSD